MQLLRVRKPARSVGISAEVPEMRELLRVLSTKGALGQVHKEQAVPMTDDPEEPMYVRFRLSEMEFYILQRLMNLDPIGVVVAPPIFREYELAWNEFENYPWRKTDLDEAVIGLTVGLMPI